MYSSPQVLSAPISAFSPLYRRFDPSFHLSHALDFSWMSSSRLLLSAACWIPKSCLCLAINVVSMGQWVFGSSWDLPCERNRYVDSEERFRGNADVVLSLVAIYGIIAFDGKWSEGSGSMGFGCDWQPTLFVSDDRFPCKLSLCPSLAPRNYKFRITANGLLLLHLIWSQVTWM